MDQIEALIHPSNQDHSNDGNQESQNFLVFFQELHTEFGSFRKESRILQVSSVTWPNCSSLLDFKEHYM